MIVGGGNLSGGILPGRGVMCRYRVPTQVAREIFRRKRAWPTATEANKLCDRTPGTHYGWTLACLRPETRARPSSSEIGGRATSRRLGTCEWYRPTLDDTRSAAWHTRRTHCRCFPTLSNHALNIFRLGFAPHFMKYCFYFEIFISILFCVCSKKTCKFD